jgi:threonine aldolase
MTIASVRKPSGLWKGACGRYGSISPTDEITPQMPDNRPTSPIIDFRSDNTGRAAPEIIAALAAANEGTAAGYGGDEWTALLQRRFGEVFETKLQVFPVATGTAANALSLAALSPSWGAVYCSEQAHVNTAEVNATGFFGGGTKLTPVAGPHGKIAADALAAVLATAGAGQTHRSQPAAVTLTQASDLGAVYALDEIRAITNLAKAQKIRAHMDGARFANALARLGCSPAEMTWRAGIDVLSFGATKNGGLLCDAIVVFDPDAASSLAVQLRRAGQVWSKMRFAAAQLLAYIEDELYLRNARAANGIAARIAAGLRDLPGVVPLAPVEANEVFLQLPAAAMDGLESDGVRFFRRPGNIARFVCRFDATAAEADGLLSSLRRHLDAKGAPR